MFHSIDVVDYHTGGEPFRIVVNGVPPLSGATVLDKRDHAIRELDDVRALLTNEPRGHADMYGCFVTEPDDESGDLGVVFFHKDGFSTACGHGTIALVTWALDSGAIPAREPTTSVVVDVPSGRLRTEATVVDERVAAVRFRNVPAFVTALDREVATSRGRVRMDVSFGGAFYGSVAVREVGLTVTPDYLEDLIRLGREIKRAWADDPSVQHPEDGRLSGLYGVIFYEEVSDHHQRNVTVFADGEVDRSPCGSGTSARLAVLYERDRIAVGQPLEHQSIVGSRFVGTIDSITPEGLVTWVEGAAFRTGVATFSLDPQDPIGLGFQLR